MFDECITAMLVREVIDKMVSISLFSGAIPKNCEVSANEHDVELCDLRRDGTAWSGPVLREGRYDFFRIYGPERRCLMQGDFRDICLDCRDLFIGMNVRVDRITIGRSDHG